jgi:hypothetical protein
MNAWSKALLLLLIVSGTTSATLAQGAQVIEYSEGRPTPYAAFVQVDSTRQALSAKSDQTDQASLRQAEFDEPKYVVDLGAIMSPPSLQPMCIRPSTNTPRIQEFGKLHKFKSDLNRTLANGSRETTIINRTSTEKPSKVALGNSVTRQ